MKKAIMITLLAFGFLAGGSVFARGKTHSSGQVAVGGVSGCQPGGYGCGQP